MTCLILKNKKLRNFKDILNIFYIIVTVIKYFSISPLIFNLNISL